jgi:ABC-2 type transport system ATP-binding protein
MTMIEVQGLAKAYGRLVAVDDLSFTVRPGEVMGLVGAKRCRQDHDVAVSLWNPSRHPGAVRLGGHDLVSGVPGRKQELAYFPDEPRLFDYLSVRQHLTFIARLYHVRDATPKAQALLAEFELSEKADVPGELSRGMKQKLAIACGLLHAPRVICLTNRSPASTPRHPPHEGHHAATRSRRRRYGDRFICCPWSRRSAATC